MFASSRPACLASALLVLSGVGAACSSHTPKPPGATPAVPAARTLSAGPPAPRRGLSVPELTLSWQPPSLTAGDIEGLRDALRVYPSAALVLGPRFAGTHRSAPLGALPTWLDPRLEVVGDAELPLGQLLQGQHELPVEREPPRETGEDDVRGPARYRWDRVEAASTEFLDKWSDDALVAIDDAEIDLQAWRSLPAHAVGSCRAPEQALALAQERSLVLLEPFLDHVDAHLAAVYRAQLRALLPGVTEELGSYQRLPEHVAFESEGAQRRYACGHAVSTYVRMFRDCMGVEQSCSVAPRIFLMEGARLGWVEPNVAVDEQCAKILGRDYVQELRGLAKEAARVVMRELDLHWSALAARLGAMSEVDAVLENVCEPRRRRFSTFDLAAFRRHLGRIGDTLRSAAPPRDDAHWASIAESFHVAGVGPVQGLARFEGGPTSPSTRAVQQARALRQMVEDRAQCVSGQDGSPLAIVLLSPEPRKVRFLGYFFPEELMCADLPPLVDHGAEAPKVAVREQG